MHVIGLLILVFLVAVLLGKNKSPYARVIIGSVFGVCFFFIWPYFLFYTRLYDWPELQVQIAYLVLCVFASLIAITLARLRSGLPVAIISFTAFVFVAIMSFTYEVEAKNHIALKTGYFDQPPVKLNVQPSPASGNRMVHPAGFELVVPARWQLQTDKGALFPYFQLKEGDSVIAELRPVCFDKQEMAITDIVFNIQQDIPQAGKAMSARHCFREQDSDITCRVSQSPTEKQVARTHWIVVRETMARGVDLDFVMFRELASMDKEMLSILASLRASDKTKITSPCLGTTDWF